MNAASQDTSNALSEFSAKLEALESLGRDFRGGKLRLAAHRGEVANRVARNRKANKAAKLARRRNRS